MELEEPLTPASIVFSFWKTTLDLANSALTDAGIQCVQIDGKIPSKRRAEILQEFSTNDETRVLLLSLSCGAVGWVERSVHAPP